MKRFYVFILLLFCCVISVEGTDAFITAEEAIEEMFPVLDENGREAATEAQNGNGFDLNAGLGKVIGLVGENLTPILLAASKTAGKLLLISLIFSMIGMTFSGNENLSKALNLAATGAIAACGIAEVNSGMQIAIDYQNRLSEFMNLLLPVLTAAGAAGGSGGESLMLQGGISLFCQLTVFAYSKIMIPFMFCYIAVRLGGAISNNEVFKKIADWVRGIVTGAMRIWLMLFLGYLSICGLAGKAADSLALRSAKTAAAAVPYIGNITSEATETIVAGTAVIKGYLGIFGTVGILGSAVVPLLSCGLGWVCIKLAGMFSSVFHNAFGSEAIETVAESFGFIFSLCSASTALILISVIVCAKTVGMP